MVKNRNAIASLPRAASTISYAYLVAENQPGVSPKDPKVKQNVVAQQNIFEFIYNPEVIQISYQIAYTKDEVPYTELSHLIFLSGGNQTISISNIYLDSRAEQKSLQPIFDKLLTLRVPTNQNGIVKQPPRVYFKWGSKRSPLCVLTSVSIQEESWLDGLPVRATLSLEFLEVNKDSLNLPSNSINKTVSEAIKKAQMNATLPKPLSEKQIQDGLKVVRAYTQANKSFLPKEAQLTLSDRNSEIRINKETGSVAIYGSLGNHVYTLGVYNGHKFNPTRNL